MRLRSNVMCAPPPMLGALLLCFATISVLYHRCSYRQKERVSEQDSIKWVYIQLKLQLTISFCTRSLISVQNRRKALEIFMSVFANLNRYKTILTVCSNSTTLGAGPDASTFRLECLRSEICSILCATVRPRATCRSLNKAEIFWNQNATSGSLECWKLPDESVGCR